MTQNPSHGIGERLGRYRRLAGMSAQQLSDAIGGEMSRAVIANIESGRKTDLTFDQVVRLAWALNIPLPALALPLERPNDDVVVARLPGDDRVVTTAELLNWMTWRPELDRANQSNFFAGTAGALAKTLLRLLTDYNHAARNLWSAREGHREGRLDYELVRERETEVDDLAAQLGDLGVDLTPARRSYGLSRLPVAKLDAENWRVDHGIPQAVVDARFVELTGG